MEEHAISSALENTTIASQACHTHITVDLDEFRNLTSNFVCYKYVRRISQTCTSKTFVLNAIAGFACKAQPPTCSLFKSNFPSFFFSASV